MRTRNRARAALRYLEATVAGDERVSLQAAAGRADTTLEVLIDPPTYRRLAADDEIVRQAAMVQRLTAFDTIVASRDAGVPLRAGHAGVRGHRVGTLDDVEPKSPRSRSSK